MLGEMLFIICYEFIIDRLSPCRVIYIDIINKTRNEKMLARFLIQLACPFRIKEYLSHLHIF